MARNSFAVLFSAVLAAVLCPSSSLAVAQLKTQGEVIADGELKAKVLAASEGIPAPTPQTHRYVVTRGEESKEVDFFRVADLWRLRAFAGEWRDRQGNMMRLARVRSLPPVFERDDWYREEIEARLAELERDFGEPDEATLGRWREAWRQVWGGKATGRFFVAGGRRYWVEFSLARGAKPGDAEKLLKAFERSVSTVTTLGGNIASMKWWERENDEYRFLTDLDRAKGGKFIDETMRLMHAMRKAYERYVPPRCAVGRSTVRVFRTLAGYREYRRSTGTPDRLSCGLWDPSRQELLIAAEDREAALATMRHEAFHQYLHFASAGAAHAQWFNEGHAAFFEDVKYSPAKDEIAVTDRGRRAEWVSRHVQAVANHLKAVVGLGHEEFYEGDVELNYCAAWALVYFLERGAWTAPEFEPYRDVIPTYLAFVAGGDDAQTATRRAWMPVAGRDLAEDFVRFWSKYRRQALTARERADGANP